jgi:hypothetical protein
MAHGEARLVSFAPLSPSLFHLVLFFCREPSLAHVKDFSPRVRRKVHGKGPLPGNLLPCGICRAMQCPEKRTSNTLPCVFTSNPVFPVVCDHGSL